MCIGNRAELSSLYVNGQLRLLYENAQHCAKKHLHGLKPSVDAVEHATCLAEFYGPVRRAQRARLDLPFFAAFDCPRIEFVCNHEAILFLNIREGHYNLDTGEVWPKKDLNVTIKDYSLAFRIPFTSQSVEKFSCKTIGNQEYYTINLHVLDVASASFALGLSTIPDLSDSTIADQLYAKDRKLKALTHYLTEFYLPVMKSAGHHVLYSLPGFDNITGTSSDIDYSVNRSDKRATDTLYGVLVDDINVFLRGLWLEAATFVDEKGLSADTMSKSFLAELRMRPEDDVDGSHLHLFFKPPRVEPLCEREVILYLDIQNVDVRFGSFASEVKQQLKDWSIAFIVDVLSDKDEQQFGKRIKLDIKSARYREHLSEFKGLVEGLVTKIKTILVQHISTFYLSIFETSSIIYYHNTTVHGPEIEGERRDKLENDADVDWPALQEETLTRTTTGEFDFITLLTQASINAHLETLWATAYHYLHQSSAMTSVQIRSDEEWQLKTCLADFSFTSPDHVGEVFFSASFNTPKIQLVCKEDSKSIILYLDIEKCRLKTLGAEKTLQPSSELQTFTHWRLAYEMDLEIIDSKEDTVAKNILKRLAMSLFKPTNYKQIVASLSSARLNLSLSTIPGFFDTSHYQAIRDRLKALAYYIQTCYFAVLKRAHHHVLYTIPHSIPGVHKNRALTSLRFEIVPFMYARGKRYLEGIFGRYRPIFERNSIVIVGMTNGRKLPEGPLPRGTNWLCGVGKEVPNGMVYLSRKSFLDGVLLQKLERINRKTTIIPTFSGVKEGRWVLEFSAWDDHELKKDAKCTLSAVTKQNDLNSLEFEWKNEESWIYKYKDNLGRSGMYSIDCVTRNTLTIPTIQAHKPAIQLKGAVKMDLKYEGSGSNNWSSETCARWSADIAFNTTSSGLQIQLNPARVVPEVQSTRGKSAHGHDTQHQALVQLKQKFPNTIDFSSLLGELKNELQGMWMTVQVQAHELCMARPFFNRHGDLLLELVVQDTQIDDALDEMMLNDVASSSTVNGTVKNPEDENGE